MSQGAKRSILQQAVRPLIVAIPANAQPARVNVLQINQIIAN